MFCSRPRVNDAVFRLRCQFGMVGVSRRHLLERVKIRPKAEGMHCVHESGPEGRRFELLCVPACVRVPVHIWAVLLLMPRRCSRRPSRYSSARIRYALALRPQPTNFPPSVTQPDTLIAFVFALGFGISRLAATATLGSASSPRCRGNSAGDARPSACFQSPRLGELTLTRTVNLKCPCTRG